MVGGDIGIGEDTGGKEGSGPGTGQPEAVELLMGVGAAVEVSPGFPCGIGGGKGLPAFTQGVEEGVGKGRIEVAEEDKGAGEAKPQLLVEEILKGGELGHAGLAGIGVLRVVGVAAFEMDMEEAEKGCPDPDSNLLDTPPEGIG